MISGFSTADLIVFIGYVLGMIGFGIWISQKEKAETSQDYFLASKALPWWAVGGSLIASNISTEQILGMNGSGFAIGLAIATYELMAALTLIIVAKYFLPIFLKKGIYTMPQFLSERFDNRVKTIMAFFWLSLYVLVNITSVLFLGGLAIQTVLGLPLLVGIAGLVIYSASFSIFGGLKAVVWTDVIQVVVLMVGGIIASWMVVSFIGDGSFFSGLSEIYRKAPEKFDMIFTKDVTYVDIETDTVKSAYDLLPGISVLIGGMWIANLYYWGNNQYIIQRALAAKSLEEAQKGTVFAAFLKLLMPLVVTIPGIATYVILSDPEAYGFTGAGIGKADEAFPWVLNNFVVTGFKGLTFAALVAAIGSSISSMVNSASTIFTLDIYKPIFTKNQASESELVRIGKLSAAGALIAGALVAPALASLEQVFQYIQEYTGLISPGVVAVFIFGLFWRRATANAALWAILLSIPLALVLKFGYPALPFLDRMGFSFLALSAVMVFMSLYEHKVTDPQKHGDWKLKLGIIASLVTISVPSGFKFLFEGDFTSVNFYFGIFILALSAYVIYVLLKENKQNDEKGIEVEPRLFQTSFVFNIATIAIFVILIMIYANFW